MLVLPRRGFSRVDIAVLQCDLKALRFAPPVKPRSEFALNLAALALQQVDSAVEFGMTNIKLNFKPTFFTIDDPENPEPRMSDFATPVLVAWQLAHPITGTSILEEFGKCCPVLPQPYLFLGRWAIIAWFACPATPVVWPDDDVKPDARI
jgi:hypothetical protein